MRHAILTAVIVNLAVSHDCACATEPEHRRHEQVTINIDRPSPTIDMSSYTLITDNRSGIGRRLLNSCESKRLCLAPRRQKTRPSSSLSSPVTSHSPMRPTSMLG